MGRGTRGTHPSAAGGRQRRGGLGGAPLTSVDVQFRRYDGLIKRRVTATLLDERDGEIRLAVPFKSTFETSRGVWTPTTAGIYRFWRGGWHNVCTVISCETRDVAFLYCDVIAPPELDGERLSFFDLDFDVLVQPDWSFRVIDEDEFAAHSVQFGYPAEIVAGATAAITGLVTALRDRTGHFATNRLMQLSDDERAAIGEP